MSLCLGNLNQTTISLLIRHWKCRERNTSTLHFYFRQEENDKFTPLLAKFENYCIPKKNLTMKRHTFNTRVQRSTELIDQFVTDLKIIAINCEIEAIKDDLIRDRYTTEIQRLHYVNGHCALISIFGLLTYQNVQLNVFA